MGSAARNETREIHVVSMQKVHVPAGPNPSTYSLIILTYAHIHM